MTTPKASDSAIAIRGIVLAAGRSSRLGGSTPKQLVPFGGVPLVGRTTRTMLASRVTETVVVTGHQHRRVRAALAGLDIQIVHNPCYRQGQSTSVQAGLHGLDPETAAVVVAPCDQPWLDVALINALIDRFQATGAAAVVPRFKGRRGAPTLLGRDVLPAIATLEGDEGARGLLRELGTAVATVEWTCERPLFDVDTAADWAAVEPYS